MSIIKNILQIIGMIILIFCGLLGMLLFIMGMVEAIPSMAVCGIIILVVSVFGSIFIGKKISKTLRPKKQNKINIVTEDNTINDDNPLHLPISPEEKFQRLIVEAPHISLNEGEVFCDESKNNVDSTYFDDLEGLEFENWCANLLRNNGFINVEVTRASGDQGVDILAEKGEIKYAIQCKCYSSDLGNSPVQEVHAGKTMYNCHVGVVMTNRHFTSGAKELAKATGVLLWDREKLLQMMSNQEEPISSSRWNNLDEKFLDAVIIAVASGQISTSLLQRKLNIGYGRAAQLIDKMEEMGIVSEADGFKPRKVLISQDDVMEKIIK